MPALIGTIEKSGQPLVGSVQAHTLVASSNYLDRSVVNSNRFLCFAIVLFLISCVFDPADRLLGLKIHLFLFCWFIALTACIAGPGRCGIHVGLLAYTLLFMLVPIFSITWYWFVDGSEPFEGFQMLKGYLLITLGALLFLRRINLLPYLAAVLTVLAITIILVFVAISVEPDLFAPLHVLGASTGIAVLDNRDYGSGLVLLQVNFVTSPMLAISIAHYFHLAKSTLNGSRRVFFGVLTMINISAMFLAGTRNNIAVAILLPLGLFFLYSRNKAINAFLCGGFLVLLVVFFFDEIQVLLDPTEFSYNIKLLLLDDYMELFTDPVNLLFGQGLGAYHYWAAKGTSFYISELTYLELIRNFGIFGAMVMLSLLLFPLLYAFIIRRSFDEKHVIVGYAAYLIMCASNPNLFSSMGILILSVVLANIFLFDCAHKQVRGRP